MCKKYIISGKAVDKVLRENRIRISRGDLEVTPYDEAVLEQEAAPGASEEEQNQEQEQEQSEQEQQQQEAAPEVPEVPVTDDKTVNGDDDKEAAPEQDAKDADPEDDSKDVTADDDSKDAQSNADKTPKKSKKSANK